MYQKRKIVSKMSNLFYIPRTNIYFAITKIKLRGVENSKIVGRPGLMNNIHYRWLEQGLNRISWEKYINKFNYFFINLGHLDNDNKLSLSSSTCGVYITGC